MWQKASSTLAATDQDACSPTHHLLKVFGKPRAVDFDLRRCRVVRGGCGWIAQDVRTLSAARMDWRSPSSGS